MKEHKLNISMNWQQVVAMVTALLTNGSTEGKRQAVEELKKMAGAADAGAKSVEKMQHALRLGREGGDDAVIRAAMVEILEKHLRELGVAS